MRPYVKRLVALAIIFFGRGNRAPTMFEIKMGVKMKKQIISLIVMLMFLMACIASAGTVNLSRTGQTKCYDSTGIEIPCADTGQDGEIQAGVAWPSPRFTDNGDGTMTDNLTGLMWTKDANLPNGTRDWYRGVS